MDSAVAVEAIACSMPVWIAETAWHASLRKNLEESQSPPRLTWFPMKADETFEAATTRIAFSLDDHHNEFAKGQGYKYLLVFGSEFLAPMALKLNELSFEKYENTDFGFVASK